MRHKNLLLFPFFMLALGFAGIALADEVEVDLTPAGEAFIDGCMSTGYSEGACVCLISYLIEDDITEQDLQDLQADDYAAEIDSCAEANGDFDEDDSDYIEEIELELTESGQQFLSGCMSGGYNEGACVCLISLLVEDGVTADNIDDIDIEAYAEDLSYCQEIN